MSVGFYQLKILDVRRETDDAISVILQPPPSVAGDFTFSPGQHLTLRAEIDGEDVRRNYSICVPPGGPLRVGIKQVPGGMFSNWAVTTFKPGGTVEAMAPRGHFTWKFDREANRNYLCFAGGSGITPILSLIEAGLVSEPGSRFTLLYGNHTSSSIMFLEQLAGIKDRFLGRFQVYHFLTAEADDIELFNGRLDESRLAQVLSTLVDPKLVDVAFICGPGPMMDAAVKALAAAGVPADRVLSERFTAGTPNPNHQRAVKAVAEKAAGLAMQITIEGRRRVVAFDAEKGSILESARAAGLPAPFACKAGVCATCRARLVAGKVQMTTNYGLSEEEVAQGYVLTCQAVPLGEGVRLDYDA